MIDWAEHISSLPAEQQVIRDQCRHPAGTFVRFPREDVEKSIPERFEAMVRRFPERSAIKMGERSVTYAELNHFANRIARAILKNQSSDARSVALFIQDRISMGAAIMGTLKAGKIFVPLDPTYPADRNAFMIGDCEAALLVCDTELDPGLTGGKSPSPCHVIELNELAAETSADNPSLPLSPDRFAYIMYTSGSTGRPRGVIGTHEMFLSEVAWSTNTLGICPQDRLTLLHSLSFSGAYYNFFGALLSGATVIPFDLKRQSYSELIRWLRDENITVFHSVPSVFRLLVEQLTRKEKFPALRLIVLGGAPVSKGDIELFRKHFPPSCALLHRMGTTESNTVCSYFIDHHAPIPGNEVPLGWSPQEKEVLILDREGQALGLDQVGEIAVRSRYLAPGYWNDFNLTKAKFLADPAGGGRRMYLTGDLGRMTANCGLIHLGRKDSQVRVRGHRVETAEIEAVLAHYPGVKEAIVTGVADSTDNARLIAYVTVDRLTPPGLNELRGFLQDSLPAYMVPSKFVILDAMPLLPNGKIDRYALPDPGQARPELPHPYVAPRSGVEADLAQIWSYLLAVDRVGVHDNFFDLGGHSLLASRVVSRVIEQFQLDVAVKALFDAPTVAEMAKIIEKSGVKAASGEEIERILGEVEAMSEEKAQRLLREELGQGEKSDAQE